MNDEIDNLVINIFQTICFISLLSSNGIYFFLCVDFNSFFTLSHVLK